MSGVEPVCEVTQPATKQASAINPNKGRIDCSEDNPMPMAFNQKERMRSNMFAPVDNAMGICSFIIH